MDRQKEGSNLLYNIEMTENIISLDYVKEIIEQGDFDKLESVVGRLYRTANDIASKSQGGRLSNESFSLAVDTDAILREISRVTARAATKDEKYTRLLASCLGALQFLSFAFNRESNFNRM